VPRLAHVRRTPAEFVWIGMLSSRCGGLSCASSRRCWACRSRGGGGRSFGASLGFVYVRNAIRSARAHPAGAVSAEISDAYLDALDAPIPSALLSLLRSNGHTVLQPVCRRLLWSLQLCKGLEGLDVMPPKGLTIAHLRCCRGVCRRARAGLLPARRPRCGQTTRRCGNAPMLRKDNDEYPEMLLCCSKRSALG
jgi:hypothetical protein